MAVKLVYDKDAGEVTVQVSIPLDSLVGEAKRKVKGTEDRKEWVRKEALAEAGKEIQAAHQAVQVTDEKIDEQVTKQQAQIAEQAADVKAARPEIIGE